MWKKISFGIFVALCLTGGILWFAYVREVKTPVSEGINAVPENASIIIESRNSSATWKKLSQTNIMWEELIGTDAFRDIHLQGRFLDSLLSGSPAVYSLTKDHPVIASVHALKNGKSGCLFVYSLPNITYREEIEEFIQTVDPRPEIHQYEGLEIRTIRTKGHGSASYTFSDGILIISRFPALVELSVQQLRSRRSFAENKNFKKLLEAAGKKVDATIYINYKNLPQLLTDHFAENFQQHASRLSAFADCSGWDITLKPNAVMLSGFTQCNDSVPDFLGAFRNQKPRTIELPEVIPSRTALLMFYGISNMKTFREDHLRYRRSQNDAGTYDSIMSEMASSGIDPEKNILSWADNEIALVITEPRNSNIKEHSYVVIRSNNIGLAKDSLRVLTEYRRGLSDSINRFSDPLKDTLTFEGHLISRLAVQNLLPALFGSNFNAVTENYFCAIGNYIVFGNSRAALQDFISSATHNNSLAEEKNYKAFCENISSEANLYIYSTINRSPDVYNEYAGKQLSADLEAHRELLLKFEAAGLQFSSSGNGSFYSNLFIKYNPSYKRETGTLWECTLDTTVSSQPYILLNHNTKAKEIFIQDDANKIYLISNTGKIIWSKQLSERLMSPVTQLDVLKNGKLQMIFNTGSFIYMFDRNGNEMAGFPIKLRSPATNSISVIDYDKNREYRIFIATANKRIVCYLANGEQLTAFKFDKTESPVFLPMQYFNASDKDHLCAVDSKGKVYILNRQGETRIRLKEQLPAGIRNFFVETGKDYSRSSLIAADTLGNVIRLYLNGDKESIRFQEFESTPHFEWKDVNNDKTPEYIFLTRNELKVFSADRSLLQMQEFPGDTVSGPPLLFRLPEGNTKIGVVSERKALIYLYNNTGTPEDGFPLKGKTNFMIEDLNNDGIMHLITAGSDNSVYVYQLE